MTSSSWSRGLGCLGKCANLCTASEIASDSKYHLPKAGKSLATRSGHPGRRRAVAGDVISEPPLFALSRDSNVTLPTNAPFFSAALLKDIALSSVSLACPPSFVNSRYIVGVRFVMSKNEVEAEGVPPSSKGSWTSFLKVGPSMTPIIILFRLANPFPLVDRVVQWRSLLSDSTCIYPFNPIAC